MDIPVDILSLIIRNFLFVVAWIGLGFGLAMICLHGIMHVFNNKRRD
jgi:hypothetical protein